MEPTAATPESYEQRLAREKAARKVAGDAAQAKIKEVAKILGVNAAFRERDDYGGDRVSAKLQFVGFEIWIDANGWNNLGRISVEPASVTVDGRPTPPRELLPYPERNSISIPSMTASLDKTAAKLAAEITRRVVDPYAAIWPMIAKQAKQREAYTDGVAKTRAEFEPRLRNLVDAGAGDYGDGTVSFKIMSVSAATARKVLDVLEAAQAEGGAS